MMMLPVSRPIWELFDSVLRYIQFPWRWLMILSLVFAVLVPSHLHTQSVRIRVIGGVAVALALLAGFAIPLYGYVRGLTWNTTVWLESAADVGVVGYAEYLPVGASLVALPRYQVPLVRSVDSTQIEYLHVEKWSGPTRSFEVATAQPQWLILRLFAFPRWHAYMNGVPTELRSTPSGEAMVYAPIGRSHFDLKFEFTVEHRAGVFISLLALAGMIFVRFLRPWQACWSRQRFGSD